MRIMSDNVPSTEQMNEKFGLVAKELTKSSRANMIFNLVQLVLLVAIAARVFDLV